MKGDLSTLASVKAYLGVNDTTGDVLLQQLISGASWMIANYCGRPTFAAAAYTEYYNGNGKQQLVLRRFPVIAVQSINFDGTTITAKASGNPPTSGWRVLDNVNAQQTLQIFGQWFCKGDANVEVNYTSGFQRTDTFVIPAGTPWQINVASLTGYAVMNDDAVAFTGGAALTEVASGPIAGQYNFAPATGLFTFAAADQSKSVDITYSYVPPDVEMVAKELAAERYKYKDRVGQVSKSMGGGVNETVTFSTKDLNDTAKNVLQNYMSTVPA